jgi:hypothetical protein
VNRNFNDNGQGMNDHWHMHTCPLGTQFPLPEPRKRTVTLMPKKESSLFIHSINFYWLLPGNTVSMGTLCDTTKHPQSGRKFW